MVTFLQRVMPILGVMLFSFGCQKNSSTSEFESITANKLVDGKFFANISIGVGVDKVDTLRMRDALKRMFVTGNGGNYKQVFDLNDKEGKIPTLADVRGSFAELRNQVASFKAKNPNGKSMVVLGITGHGTTAYKGAGKSAQFSFLVKEEKTKETSEYLSGKDFVDIFTGVDADEMIVFVQSCESGSLVETEIIHRFAKEMGAYANQEGRQWAVVVPVSENISSPVEVWEYVLEKSYTELLNKPDDLVTYEAFKDRVMFNACSHPAYVPGNVVPKDNDDIAGVDPRFYENISPNLPMFLTSKGMQKYLKGEVKFEPLKSRLSVVSTSAETSLLCEQNALKYKLPKSPKSDIPPPKVDSAPAGNPVAPAIYTSAPDGEGSSPSGNTSDTAD